MVDRPCLCPIIPKNRGDTRLEGPGLVPRAFTFRAELCFVQNPCHKCLLQIRIRRLSHSSAGCLARPLPPVAAARSCEEPV